MEKLNIKDIKIKSSGYFVRLEILKKYPTIEAFADSIGIYKDSVEKYLDSSKLGSATFKLKLVQCLDKGINDIVITRENQIRSLVDNVTNNLDMYKGKEDAVLLQKIKGICLKDKMHVETAKMFRAIAMNKFYNGKSSAALELLKLSIEMLDNENKDELVFEYTSELGLVYFYESEYKNATEAMKSINYYLEKYEFDRKILHFYYYRLGQINNMLGEYQVARDYYNKSLQYSDSNYNESRTLMNIGITYKNEKSYRKALQIYKSVYSLIESNDYIMISVIDNNIAELYRDMGLADKAEDYANKALRLIGDTNIQKKFIYTQTYVQIKMMKGEQEEAIQKLISLIRYCKNRFLYKKHIIEGMSILVNYALDSEDVAILHKLEKEILKLIGKPKVKNMYITEMKALLCDILLYYRGKEVVI